MKNQVLLLSFLACFLATYKAQALSHFGVDSIYDLDDRISIEDEESRETKKLSEAVGLIFQRDFLIEGVFTSKISATSLDQSMPICPDVKFKKELTLNSCTGFLIAPDLMVSAGHCFQNAEDCQNKAIAFDLQQEAQRDNYYKVSNRNVYKCQQIITSVFNEDQDFALIRLDRETKRLPLKFRQRGVLSSRDSVFMLGHPMGQPLKKSAPVKVGDLSNKVFFKAPLDSFSGNSGSPVINSRTLLVEGILVRGEEDFLLDKTNQCYLYQVYDSSLASNEESPRGEGITRISEILPFLSK